MVLHFDASLTQTKKWAPKKSQKKTKFAKIEIWAAKHMENLMVLPQKFQKIPKMQNWIKIEFLAPPKFPEKAKFAKIEIWSEKHMENLMVLLQKFQKIPKMQN